MDSNSAQKLRTTFSLVVIIALLTGTGIGVVVSSELGWLPSLHAQVSGPASIEPSAFLVSTQESFRELVGEIRPAVVSIEAVGTALEGMNNLDPFEQYFGIPHPFLNPEDMQGYEIPTVSAGSGFFVNPDGYLLTNNHVISGADEVEITLDDGTRMSAELVGTDPETDVAVLKAEGDGPFPYLEMGDSEELQVGDWVIAAGNPFGTLAGSVTVGIVSAKNREYLQLPGGLYYEDFIQTDAAINLGNSGGPLVDIYGHVVGINTAITAQGTGIGFTIPINLAKFVYNSLLENGEVIRGWIGVTIQNLDSDLAANLGLNSTNGALVAGVVEGDPAAEAGLQEGDVILEVDGNQVTSTQSASRFIAMLPVGESSEFLIFRDGREMTLEVTPARRGDGPSRAQEGKPVQNEDRGTGTVKIEDAYLGIEVMELDRSTRRNYDIPDDMTGVIVSSVDMSGTGFDKGMREGDVISEINHVEISTVDEYTEQMGYAYDDWRADEQTVLLRVFTLSQDGQYFRRFLAVPFE